MYIYPMENEYQTIRITDIDESERPRERLARLGAGSLSVAELLGILLRMGIPGENAVQVGQRLFKDLNGLRGLQKASFDDLCNQNGIGPAKAAQIKAAIELGYRLAIEAPEDRPAIHSPTDAANLVMYEMAALDQEEMWVLMMDTRNRVINKHKLYKGSTTSSQIRVGEMFRPAIRIGSTSIIAVHNHPSGDPTPSPDDVAVTRALVSAGKLLDIEVLDHLVIGLGRFVSMKERGLGFG